MPASDLSDPALPSDPAPASPYPKTDSALVFPLLGELPESLFPDSFVESAALAEDYGHAWALALARSLGLEAALSRGADAASLAAEKGFAPGFGFALDWLLASLAAGGWVSREDDRYHLHGALPEAPLARLRAELLAADPGNAPTLALLDAAAAAYPAVARGERTGEEVLLGPAGMGLWASYFGTDNPLYAINNRIAALAAAHRLPAAGSLRVLEVGAGGGSGTQALLEALTGTGALPRLAAYRATEPSPFFRRRSQRALPAAWPGVPLSFGDLDIDQPWTPQLGGDQIAAPGSLDLVYAVNVLHVAKDLRSSLSEAYRALAPGGWLVAGECVRPFPSRPVAAELVFGLLAGFREVATDPDLRPSPGFLTPEQWTRILEHTGFTEVTIVPDLARIREVTPNFLTGAVCGRRPV